MLHLLAAEASLRCIPMSLIKICPPELHARVSGEFKRLKHAVLIRSPQLSGIKPL